MIFSLVLKIGISYRVFTSWRVLVSFKGLCWRLYFCMRKYLRKRDQTPNRFSHLNLIPTGVSPPPPVLNLPFLCTFTAGGGHIFSLGDSSLVKTKSCNKKLVNSYPVSLNGTEFLSLLWSVTFKLGMKQGLIQGSKTKRLYHGYLTFYISFMPHKILSQKGVKHPNKSVKFSSQF
jgi:hypothetical protein